MVVAKAQTKIATNAKHLISKAVTNLPRLTQGRGRSFFCVRSARNEKHEIERIGDLLDLLPGFTWKTISGKHEFDGKFDVDVIILQIQSGEAVDLSDANTYIFYSWNHSLINFEQARFRVQAFDTTQVNYWYLIATGTIDEPMHEAVVEKKKVSTLVCDKYRRAA